MMFIIIEGDIYKLSLHVDMMNSVSKSGSLTEIKSMMIRVSIK
jgi:hypothetical protein